MIDRHWSPDPNQQILIRRASQMLKAGDTPYSDLAIILASTELNLDVSAERIQALGHLAFLEAVK